MKKVRDHGGGGAISGVTVTPVINVTFVLLIIMFVAAPSISVPDIQVDLPVAHTSEAKEKNIAVSLSADRQFAVDERVVTIQELPSYLNAMLKKKDYPVVILRADKDVAYEEVENLIEFLKYKTKSRQIALATRQQPLETAP